MRAWWGLPSREEDEPARARGRERDKRVGATALASAGARGIAMLAGLITVPLTLHALGPEQFGLLTTVTSLTAILVGVADLGLSNGLINAVSEAYGKDDRELARRSVSSAFYLLTTVGVVVGAIFLATYSAVPWARLLNVHTASAASVAGPAVAVVVLLTLGGLPLGTVNNVQLGYQQGYRSSLWSAAGSVITLAAIAVAVAGHASLPVLVLAIAGGPLLANLLNGISTVRRQPWLTPSIRALGFRAAVKMLRVGSLFFALQLAGFAAWQIDNIIIARILGASAVTQYAVPMKLFALIPVVLNFGLLPLWPAYREALLQGDIAWMRRTYIRSMTLVLAISVPASAFLVVFGNPLIHLWVGPSVEPTVVLLLALGIWTVVFSASTVNGMLLNGAHVVGFQVVCAALMVVANVFISILATRRVGVSGPAWGSAVAVIAFDLIPCTWYSLRILSRPPRADRPAG